ncbi:MAG: hypothetical protein ACKVZ0_24095 [Gemmatimonadales bacterium]
MLGVAATGIVALLVWKALALFLLPFLGLAIGFLFVVVKIVFWGVIICLGIWIYRRMARRQEC